MIVSLACSLRLNTGCVKVPIPLINELQFVHLFVTAGYRCLKIQI